MMILRTAFVSLIFLALVACSGSETGVTSAPDRPKVAVDAYSLMTPDSYPKMFARLGASRFEEANRKTAAAMDAISQFPSCDGVEDGGISDMETTKQEIHWYAHCYNGVKITVSENDFIAK